jgi:predicted methyltransferase
MRRSALYAAVPVVRSCSRLDGAAVNAAENPLQRAIENAGRNPTSVARDSARHPREVLTFLGIRPDVSVVEIWPGSGYWTEILSPYLYAQGIYHVALGDPRDTTHWPRGVWTLPPTYRLGALDRDKYQKVGEADNFLRKFRKVE